MVAGALNVRVTRRGGIPTKNCRRGPRKVPVNGKTRNTTMHCLMKNVGHCTGRHSCLRQSRHRMKRSHHWKPRRRTIRHRHRRKSALNPPFPLRWTQKNQNLVTQPISHRKPLRLMTGAMIGGLIITGGVKVAGRTPLRRPRNTLSHWLRKTTRTNPTKHR